VAKKKNTMEEVAKKIRPWVKTILVSCIAIAGIISAIVVAYFYVTTLLKGYSLGAEDKYEFFRDILIITLSIMAVFFAAIVFWIHVFISERVENRVENSVGDQSKRQDEKFFKYTLGTSLLNNGFIFWKLYQTTKEEPYLNSAIQLTEEANFILKGLDEKVSAHKLAKCQTMNNLGFYLAKRGKPEDIQYAITCAEFILKRLESFPEQRASWMDTYEYIMSKKGKIQVPQGPVV
jgi:magnesium-transporting ATPase (P-type)